VSATPALTMKLVDYSDSEPEDELEVSDKENPASPVPSSPPPAPRLHHANLPPNSTSTAAKTAAKKKPTGKRQIIIDDLPKPSALSASEDGAPAQKRVKREGAGGSGLFATLPPPKRTKPPPPKPAENVEPLEAETRANDVQSLHKEETEMPAPSVTSFMPRSAKSSKSTKIQLATVKPPTPPISLFPLGPDLTSKPIPIGTPTPASYQPLIANSITRVQQPLAEEFDEEPFIPDTTAPLPSNSTLSTSELDAFAAHILEGRHRKNRAIQIKDYNAGEVYAQNAADRASGALQEQIAPVRAIGTGRHQLTQLLNNVQDQRESLEEAFAKGRRIKKESAAKYGW
jgi:Mitotic checkpoint regulator, MAD2B-interacting